MTSEERHKAREQRRRAKRAEKRRKDLEQYDNYDNVISSRALYRAAVVSRHGVGWKASVQRYHINLLRNTWDLHRKLMNGEKPALTAGEQEWDFCFSGDVAEALVRMAISGRDGAVYPVGSGTTRTLRSCFELARDAVDPALPLGIGELPYPPNQVMRLQADLTPLRADTGFEPKVPFEEGIRITAEAFRKKENGQQD